jgi:signal transduction histidine kinase
MSHSVLKSRGAVQQRKIQLEHCVRKLLQRLRSTTPSAKMIFTHEHIIRAIETNSSFQHHPERIDRRVEMEVVLATVLLDDLDDALNQRAGCEAVVAELVANSLGHAFPVRAGTIAIVLTRLSPTRAQLEIRDDGIGFHVEAASDRHGVGLAKRLMERIDGTLDVHSGKGTTWTLSFAVASDGAKKAA